MSIDTPGFANPVDDAQTAFRSVLDAMARPGSSHSAGTGLTPPPCLDPATAAMLLTLADAETPVFLAPELEPARDWVAFHCGAALLAEPARAAFVVATSLPDLTALDSGTDEAPENSATVILQLPALGEGPAWALAGPGLREPGILRARGLPADFAAAWARNHAAFPRGIDLILCAGAVLVALPRSLRITES